MLVSPPVARVLLACPSEWFDCVPKSAFNARSLGYGQA
jgi:hypothetical protein